MHSGGSTVLLFLVLLVTGLALVVIGLALGRERRRRMLATRVCRATHCGHANAPAARFCARCGEALDPRE
jgi:hypothetical protein